MGAYPLSVNWCRIFLGVYADNGIVHTVSDAFRIQMALLQPLTARLLRNAHWWQGYHRQRTRLSRTGKHGDVGEGRAGHGGGEGGL